MKKENYDDLEMLFNEEVELPQELSKENIIKNLKSADQTKKKKVSFFPKLVAAAAAVAVVSAAVFGSGMFSGKNKVIVSNSEGSSDITDSLLHFSNQQELEEYFENIKKETYVSSESWYQRILSGLGVYKNSTDSNIDDVDGMPSDTVSVTQSAAQAYSASTSTDSSYSYAQTNTQVSGVDEADIIKNDGRYIYIASNSNLLTIVDTQTMQTVFSKSIASNNKNADLIVDDIYLNGNTLVAVCEEYEKLDYDDNDESMLSADGSYVIACYDYARIASGTVNIIFDVSDKSNPKELRRVLQDGSVSSTRMIGDILYTVTEYTPDLTQNDYECNPEVGGEKIDVESIFVENKEENNTTYTVLSAFDTSNSSSEISKISVLSSSTDIYCSNDTLYIYGYDWNDENLQETTNITSISFRGTDLTYLASGSINGSVDSQYSFDASGDYLRVAVTDYNYETEKYVSSIYVLDKNLNTVGKLEDIAKNEQIKSVRYIGDVAYVVTFENTDPLFAIDLSDPKNPTVLGKLKLPGFSDYLHPLGNGLLLGVGYSGDDENADFESVKVSLFDISDPAEPKELDSLVFKNAVSDVNYDVKAFVFYSEKSLIGIPLTYETQTDDDYEENFVFKLISFENGRLSVKQTLSHPELSLDKDKIYYGENGEEYYDFYFSFCRGSYIGEKVYTVTNFSVAEFDLESGNQLRTLEYYLPKEAEE